MSSTNYHTQKMEELRLGEQWNQQLLNPANRSNTDILERFWAEMKVRVCRHYGSITKCFHDVDTSGDGSISFLEFIEMLTTVNLPLEMKVARPLFDKASCGHHELSLRDLKLLLMEKTIQKMQHSMRGFNKKQDRVRREVHCFLKYLILGNETMLSHATDRLQRKLTMTFIRDFWKKLEAHVAKSMAPTSTEAADLERAAFLQVAHGMIGSGFMAVEVVFLMRIFDRIDVHSKGCIHMCDMVTTLVLISEESCKETKLHFLFEVFDDDLDGCLVYDQILAMMRCICTHRPLIEDNTTMIQAAKNESGLAFAEELTAQDGLRLYECLFWYLQRTAKLDSCIVTWKELWHAFENQPEVANSVFPGLFHIGWVLKSSGKDQFDRIVDPDDPPETFLDHERTPSRGGNSCRHEHERSRTMSSAFCDHHDRTPSRGGHRTSILSKMEEHGGPDHERTPSRRETQRSSILGNITLDEHGGVIAMANRNSWTFNESPQADGTPHRRSASKSVIVDHVSFHMEGHRRTTSSISTPGDAKGAELADGTPHRHHAAAHTPDSKARQSHDHHSESKHGSKDDENTTIDMRSAFRSTTFGQKLTKRKSTKPTKCRETTAWEVPRETSATFKRAVTSRFLTSLRNFSDVRCAELDEGFKSVEEQLANKEAEGNPAADIARPNSSPAGLMASPGNAMQFTPELARPGSSPAIGGQRSSLNGKVRAREMPRISSAPTVGLEKRSEASDLAKARQAGRQQALPSTDVPKMGSQRWGLEAADRFRLFSTVKSGPNAAQHLGTSFSCGGCEGLGYKCQLCQRDHMMVTSW